MAENRDTIIHDIVTKMRTHDIMVEELSAKLVHDKNRPEKTGLASKLFFYIGVIFILSGLSLLTSLIWDDISRPARVIITLGPGLAAFTIAFLASNDPKYARIAAVLFGTAALLQPSGLFVFLNEYYPDGGDLQLAAISIFLVMALQHGLSFYKTGYTVLLFFTLTFWYSAFGMIMQRVEIPGDIFGIILGAMILAITYGIDKTRHRAICGFWYFIGAIGFLWSVFDVLEGTSVDLLFLLVNIPIIYLSVRIGSRTLLFVSVATLFCFLSYYAYENFAHVIGWPITMIAMGFVLLGMGRYTMKLSERISKDKTA